MLKLLDRLLLVRLMGLPPAGPEWDAYFDATLAEALDV